MIDGGKILEIAFRYSSDLETFRDNSGKVIYCSQSIEHIIGYTAEEYLSGKITPKDFIHPDDYEKTLAALSKLSTDEDVHSLIVRYIHKNGNVIWIELTGRQVVIDGEKIGIRISGRDITEKVMLEQELRKMNAAKDKFYSVISHDLRSPCIGLLSLTQMMLDDLDRMSTKEMRENITLLHQASRHTLELLDNLLTWTRSQSGRMEAKPDDVNLKLVSDEVVSLLKVAAQKKGIQLHSSIDQHITLYADKDMLHTIIRNLVSNAIKYTTESGSIAIQAICYNGFAEIAVSDTGVGMSDKIKNSLFVLGESYPIPGTAKEKGTGLGLILCKEFVEKHGGRIWVESELDKGSVFRFTMPLTK